MNSCRVWVEDVSFKTYLTGKQDKHPLFMENRVYQGSSGSVYPYGVTDTLSDKTEQRKYKAVFLENDFIKVMILPEIGGRIHRAYDKINKRDFIYYNQVIKPALVGLLGPWISGGIEFNWPQHHRPTTFMETDFECSVGDDGTATVIVGEREPMHGLMVNTFFTLYKDKALIEVKSKIYNPNSTPRSFLWWANPAVKGGDSHQTIFPPDVTAVFDHGKRAVIDFPIAHGEYYKVKYDGIDISRYKNIPVPTSYMAWHSNYDFVGAYCHDENGGLLHIASHHIAPGKKQWTWGNGDFGRAWERILTDNDGPYVELMTGVFTDNQPDFSWISPSEVKEFTQYFLPYSNLCMIHNANSNAAIKLERENGKIILGVYAAAFVKGVLVLLNDKGDELLSYDVDLAPCRSCEFEHADDFRDIRLTLLLKDIEGHKIISYKEHLKEENTFLPQTAKAPSEPDYICSADEAYIVGRHLEQYHHASFHPEDYYLRGLELDSGNCLCNLAMGQFEFDRCHYREALIYAKRGLNRLLMLNQNPEDGRLSLLKAHCHLKLGMPDEAYDEYYRAVWSSNTKCNGFLGLCKIMFIKKNYVKAHWFAIQALNIEPQCHEALFIKAYTAFILDDENAFEYFDSFKRSYPVSALASFISYSFICHDLKRLKAQLNDREINYLEIARILLELGQEDKLAELFEKLSPCGAICTLIAAAITPDTAKRISIIESASKEFDKFVRFPNLNFERDYLGKLNESSFALHLCACFDYAHRLYEDAAALWKKALEIDRNDVYSLRGLGMYSHNRSCDGEDAVMYYLKALDESKDKDERIICELDMLLKEYCYKPQQRLYMLNGYDPETFVRDDLKLEYITLLIITGQEDLADEYLASRRFHVFEGGEGKLARLYIAVKILRSVVLYSKGEVKKALDEVLKALTYPENIGEGRLIGQTDNDVYYFAAYYSKKLGNTDDYTRYLKLALRGELHVFEQHYYNDQPIDYVFFHALALKEEGRIKESSEVFNSLKNWAIRHKDDHAKKDFFAVSLPNLATLNTDADRQHQENCLCMILLSAIGLDDRTLYKSALSSLNKLNPNSFKAYMYKKLYIYLI